jgi:predicted Zn-dependent peptidase
MRTRTRTLTTAVAAIMAAAAAHGQAPPPAQPPSSKAVVIKGKAPVSDEVLQVRLPRPAELTLPNGLHLLVLQDRRVPRVTMQLIIPGAGGYYDPQELPGAASVTAAMMREGTASRTSAQLSEQLETIAAFLNVGTGMSSTDATLSGSCLSEHTDKLFEILADVLLNPSFPDEELERYKQRTRAALVQQRSNAGFLGAEMFARVLNGSHPASRISLTPDTLGRMTADALRGFHRARFVPDHAALAVAGDISLPEVRKLAETKLAGWKKAGASRPTVTDPADPGAAKVTFVARPNSVQTNLLVGTPAIRRLDPDYDVLQVMNKVIGGGPTGRLFITLREEKGYTYGAYSSLNAGEWRGVWQASTEVRTDVTEAALRDLLAEVARVRDEAVPGKELKDQKRAMIGSFALSLENPQQMLGYYVTSWRYGLPADYWDKYPERITAVTEAQVRAAARKYLDPARLQVIAVGEPAKVSDVLRKFGTVETYDTEGKRLTASTPSQ